ncbi:hypothetical protein Bca4012_078990 [Brassica carinata]
MHLWPSLKLRNSFKSTSKKKYQRTNSSGQHSQSNQQKLLESGPEIPSGNWFYVVCGDLAMVLSCCFCCFCCGGKPFQFFFPLYKPFPLLYMSPDETRL